MSRFRLILVLLACVYVASWFLPVVVAHSGYEAFWNALYYGSNGGPFGTPRWVGEIWTRASALSNVLFVMTTAILLRSPRRTFPWMVWGAIGCAAINSLWWAGIRWEGNDYLKIGYYLWLGSFVALAAVAWFAKRASSVKRQD